jgi:hypothetical protein
MTEIPPPAAAFVEEIRAWISPTNATDDMILTVTAAELENQELVCSWPGRGADPPAVRPDALDQALKRRVARALAARGVTLGVISTDADLGATRLPRWDAEIERYEAPYRVVAIA